jgi:hypothetical protein
MVLITVSLKQMNPQNTFSVTIEENATIAALKEKIKEINGVLPDNQRVIYAGQILKNERTVDSYGTFCCSFCFFLFLIHLTYAIFRNQG